MTYIVAVKRATRNQLKETLPQLLAKIAGARNISGDKDSVRIQVDLTPEDVAQLQELGAGLLHIEPLIPHNT